MPVKVFVVEPTCISESSSHGSPLEESRVPPVRIVVFKDEPESYTMAIAVPVPKSLLLVDSNLENSASTRSMNFALPRSSLFTAKANETGRRAKKNMGL
jgi:hypothetical protein